MFKQRMEYVEKTEKLRKKILINFTRLQVILTN